MDVRLTILYKGQRVLYNTVQKVPDEGSLEEFRDLLAKAASGEVTYLKLGTNDGEEVVLGKRLLERSQFIVTIETLVDNGV